MRLEEEGRSTEKREEGWLHCPVVGVWNSSRKVGRCDRAVGELSGVCSGTRDVVDHMVPVSAQECH